MNLKNEKDIFVALENELDLLGKHVIKKISALMKSNYPTLDLKTFFKVPPHHRVKDPGTYIEKIIRKSNKYTSPITEITDKVGVRFIVINSSDIDKVAAIFNDPTLNWEISKDRDFKEERKKEPLLFDYQSDHYVVTPKEEFDGVTPKKELSCEIQVRTLMQHAYAELSHEVGYKPRFISEGQNKRLLARSIALVETIDENFDNIYESYMKTYFTIKNNMKTVADYFQGMGFKETPYTKLSEEIFEAFSDLLPSKDLNNALNAFVASKPNIKEWIKKNGSDSDIFKQPTILALYYLAENHRHSLLDKTPFDPDLLEPIFTNLGISYEDLSS